MTPTHYVATFGGQAAPVAAGFRALKKQHPTLSHVILIVDDMTAEATPRLEALKAWFRTQDVNVLPDLTNPGALNMRQLLPPLLHHAVLNVTGGTKALALRVTDVALELDRPVFVVDAHGPVSRLRSVTGSGSTSLSGTLSAREHFALSGQPGSLQALGAQDLGEDETQALKRLGLDGQGVLFSFQDAHDAVRTEDATQRGVLFVGQGGALRAVCLTPFPDRTVERSASLTNLRARAFVEFVRRHFGDTAEPGWLAQPLNPEVNRYLQLLGTVHDGAASSPVLPPTPLPSLPTLGRQVLLCVVGEQPMPAVVAALHGAPDTVLLLGTPSVRPTLGRVRTLLQSRGLDVHALEVDDMKPEQAHDLTAELLARLGDGQLRLNVSGGTKAMALQAYRALRLTPHVSATTEYTRGSSVQTLRPHRLPEVHVPVVLSLTERLALFGLRPTQPPVTNPQFPPALVGAAEHVMKVKSQPEAADLEQARLNFVGAWKDARLPVQALHDVQKSGNPNRTRSLLRGLAFETIMAARLKQALPDPAAQLAMGVEITSQEWSGDAQTGHDGRSATPYRREIDVLIETRGVLIVVEVKSKLIEGLTKQLEHFDAVELAQRLGGRYTHTMLVGAQPPDERDLHDPSLNEVWQEALTASRPDGDFSLHVTRTRTGRHPEGVSLADVQTLRGSLRNILQTRGGAA